MDTVTLPEMQSEYDVLNLTYRYGVRVDDWALTGGVDHESGLYKLALNQYPPSGPTYRTSMFAVEPPGGSVDLDGYAARLAHAHGIPEPAWLAPSLREIVRRLDADWNRSV